MREWHEDKFGTEGRDTGDKKKGKKMTFVFPFILFSVFLSTVVVICFFKSNLK